MSVECRVSSVEMGAADAEKAGITLAVLDCGSHDPALEGSSPVTRHVPAVPKLLSEGWSRLSAFTLVELLVVLSILGILAALVVPALKNFGHSDATISASRQLLDDVARARQLAISRRTTVYMVFVPKNFWIIGGGPFPDAQWWPSLTSAQRTVVTNLCDKQLTGYTFIAHGAMGDQPGQHNWHYLAPWQNLPDNTFIAQWKFSQTTPPLKFNDPIDSTKTFSIYPFDYTNNIPFPTEDSSNPTVTFPWLPYIAFNYLGQLISSGKDTDPSGNGEDIPLARGSVIPAIDTATKAFLLLNSPDGSPDVSEIPAGNSTNAYNIIDIEPLTGRATLQQPKMQ